MVASCRRMQGDLRLTISPGVGDALAVILTTALRLPAGSDVVDSLPSNPWGDVERFRSEVYDPVLGKAPPTEIESGLALYVPGADQARPPVMSRRHASDVPTHKSYEIGVVDGVPAPVVVHAMKARDKFLR